MMATTRLKRTKRGLVAVYVDGRYWRSLPPDIVAEHGLVDEGEIPAELMTIIDESADRRRAMDIALSYLGYRARSRLEVVKRLLKAGIDDKTIEFVLERLEGLGYLDDEAFARDWIASRITAKRYGRRRIENELLARGVLPEVVREGIAKACSGEDEERRAVEAAQSRLARIESIDDGRMPRRLVEYLVRRGYSIDVAYRVTRTLLDGVSRDGEAE